MSEIPDAGSVNDLAHEDEELGLAVQHLAIQNMHLTRQLQDCHRKMREFESKMQHAKQESYLAKQNSEHLQEKLKMLEAEKDKETVKTEPPKERLTPSTSQVCTQNEVATQTDESNDKTETVDDDHIAKNRMEMEKFREEMNNRREARHRAIGAVSSELERLRAELAAEKLARQRTEEQLEEMIAVRERQEIQASKNNMDLLEKLEVVKNELAQENKRIQEVLTESKRLETENEHLLNRFKDESLKFEAKEKYSKRCIGALKEVASLSKQMLSIRESQVSNLKRKIEYLQESMVGNKDTVEIKAELESHIQNLNKLQITYEERIAGLTEENNKLKQETKEQSEELENSEKKCSDLKARLAEMETIDLERDEINRSLQTQLQLSCDERNSLANERTLINNIFSQMLAANSSTDMDLDKLVKMLKENHDLITEMTTRDDGNNTVAGLPKLVVDLINQIDNEDTNSSPTSEISRSSEEDAQEGSSGSEQTTPVNEESSLGLNAEEIASNLPKVCRVLTELLSHHKVPSPAEEFKPSCYKSVETPTGPRLVPSVSNTYIRLKDLILEKKSLVRDLGKLKQLNSHLESKLEEQERRLSFVSDELKKTWGVVGKLRSQYKQLRTHEQILRYELQQKRHLLTELKTELEYCREKWEQAREMNNKTEIQWKQLRQEFADRKKQDRNNSGESGFSDDREVESSEEDEKTCSRPHDDGTAIQTETRPYSTWVQHTIPLHFITNLKQQLDIFSRDIDSLVITETQRYLDKQLIDSIFSLPPIEIPDLILNKSKNNSFSHITCKKECTSTTKDRNSSQRNQPTASTSRTNVQEAISSETLDQQHGPRADEKPSEIKPSSSGDNVVRDALGRTPEEVLAARAARLKRLEEQTQLLFNKVTRTTNLSNALNNRLEELHEQYGVPNPPPLPQTLPAIRIPLQSPSEATSDASQETTASTDNVPEEKHQP